MNQKRNISYTNLNEIDEEKHTDLLMPHKFVKEKYAFIRLNKR